MATRVVDRAVLDTNILLAATDEVRPDHEDALATLNEWPAAGTALYTSGQILREYLAVATRRIEHNGLGLPQLAAVANTRALRGRLHVMAETSRVSACLLELLDEIQCESKQVHDANVVATMLVYGVGTVVTLNTRDFARFEGRVEVIGPRL